MFGSGIIRTNTYEYRIWKKKNDLLKLSRKLNSKEKKKIRNSNYHSKSPSFNSNYFRFSIPGRFSIIDNPDETIYFLNDIIKKIDYIRLNARKINDRYIDSYTIFLDIADTSYITSDALMYLLTLIQNTRGDKFLPVDWKGNFPRNEDVELFLKKSGFLKYMRTSQKNILRSTELVQIITGHTYVYFNGVDNVDIRKEIVDFTSAKLGVDKSKVTFLTTMLTEMTSNIGDHAYDDEGLFSHSWYMFVENKNDSIAYTFMDNGLGIPTTIKKGMLEKIFSFFNADKEYKYIEAGVSGIQKRTQTGKIERGNGLPSIYEQYTNGFVDNLKIISNKAFYDSNPRDLKYNLVGTIYYWEITKKEMI